MKRKFKSILSVLLTGIMILAMSSTAFAANEPTTGLLKISDTRANTFTAYQVMTSEVAGYDNTGAPMYAYTVNPAFADFFANSTVYSLDAQNNILKADGSAVVTDGTTANTNTSEASALATALEQYAKTNGIAGTTVSRDGATLAIGYYVVSETASVSENAVASKPILVDLRGDTTIKTKNSEVEITKKIVEGTNKVDANNVSIGDTVSYEVTTAIPTYENNVDKTKLVYTLTDTFTHLTYNKDVKVVVGGVELVKGADYTITEEDGSFVINLTQDVIYANQGQTVTLTYSAVLNETAVVDSTAGNPNKIELEYTNNPNMDNSYDVLTDEVKTYTYGFKIHKVDKNDETKDMAGATFEVRNAAGTLIGTFTYGENGNITAEGILITTDGNYATLTGLDAGTYTITETVAPSGYSLLGSPVTVMISDEGENAGGLPNGIAKIVVTGQGTAESDVVDNGDGTIDLVVKIINTQGISLPETGAMTTLYCLVGGAVLLAAGTIYYRNTKKTGKASK